jgi:hypothetical protein
MYQKERKRSFKWNKKRKGGRKGIA